MRGLIERVAYESEGRRPSPCHSRRLRIAETFCKWALQGKSLGIGWPDVDIIGFSPYGPNWPKTLNPLLQGPNWP